jgi:hypothetical protein
MQDDLFKLPFDTSTTTTATSTSLPSSSQLQQLRIQPSQLPGYEDLETQMTAPPPASSSGGLSLGFNLVAKLRRESSAKSVDRPKSPQPPVVFYKEVPEGEARSNYGLFTHKIYKIDSKVPW